MTTETTMETNIGDVIEKDGFVVVAAGVGSELLDELSAAVKAVKPGDGVFARDGVYAVRNLLSRVPAVTKLLDAPALRSAVESVLGPEAFLVRGMFLSKTPKANWKVPFHQDASVTVREKEDVTGFGPWSMKAGVQHVGAPPGVLAAMLTVRVHLDDCNETSGALRVIPASHQYGRLPVDSIPEFTRTANTLCEVPRGGLMLMRPLLLHASSAATEGGPRRVIELCFSSSRLPSPLEWHESHRLN